MKLIVLYSKSFLKGSLQTPACKYLFTHTHNKVKLGVLASAVYDIVIFIAAVQEHENWPLDDKKHD